MMDASEVPNPLLSLRPSDSGFQVQLHPLVLLTISDHITRHHVRQQKGPVVGALLGQQKGREISFEQAFECKILGGGDEPVVLDQAWFEERLQQYKDVHKDPALDLVGWFTLCSSSGPTVDLLPIHTQMIQEYNESALLLAFHPSSITKQDNAGGKLPITIYESVFEHDAAAEVDKSMEVDGEDPSSPGIKFRQLPFSVETDETEMIGVDFVARGGGNATALEMVAPPPEKPDRKGKKRAASDQEEIPKKTVDGAKEANPLSPVDEDLIATLTTRLNSVKMLQSRIHLLKSYVAALPLSYLNSEIQEPPTSNPTQESESQAPLSHPLLRTLLSLTSRLAILTPTIASNTTASTFSDATLAAENDVQLISLLGTLGKDVQGLRELGRKFAVVENARQQSASRKGGAKLGGGGFGGFGGIGGMDSDEIFGGRPGGGFGRAMEI